MKKEEIIFFFSGSFRHRAVSVSSSCSCRFVKKNNKKKIIKKIRIKIDILILKNTYYIISIIEYFIIL